RDLAAVRRDDARQRRRVRAGRNSHRRGRHSLPDVGDARRGRRLCADRAALAARGLGDRRRLVGAAGADRRAPGRVRGALRRLASGVDRRPRLTPLLPPMTGGMPLLPPVLPLPRATPAAAHQNAFGPLPAPAPTATAVPTATASTSSDSGSNRNTLF